MAFGEATKTFADLIYHCPREVLNHEILKEILGQLESILKVCATTEIWAQRAVPLTETYLKLLDC
ncbi:hypothetical protein GN958_ATG19433 [Phytophthora infestans]|uniref:Uncharacterized protein n=1 Tax=Phytophthora infestans TaxID=4787 RepID=A0A8S9TTL6_PHYIN|nr:hypothetical protein GN958_ATG19433 [Phytophthora infestans]